MTVPIEIRKRAIALVEQLPGESLVKAVEFLESLSDEALQGSQTTMPQAYLVKIANTSKGQFF